jgi:2-methylisocitrate lyase-like PEP mutase family enzyme
MAASFAEKAGRYRELHARDVFVAGGCWDAGTARLLAHARLPCLETSSAGVMFARGLPDGDGLATRDIMLENARLVAAGFRQLSRQRTLFRRQRPGYRAAGQEGRG